MVKVIWTDAALNELDDIGEFIAKDSHRYAEITVNELFNSVDILEQHPRAGVKVPEFKLDEIRQIVKGNYRIVYQIIDDYRIDIVTVHNCARLLSNTEAFNEK